MKRLAITGIFLMVMVVFYPRTGFGANIGGCPSNGQYVNIAGTITGTAHNFGFSYDTDLTCGDDYYIALYQAAGAALPAQCIEGSHFTASGTIKCYDWKNETGFEDYCDVRVSSITCNQ